MEVEGWRKYLERKSIDWLHWALLCDQVVIKTEHKSSILSTFVHQEIEEKEITKGAWEYLTHDTAILIGVMFICVIFVYFIDYFLQIFAGLGAGLANKDTPNVSPCSTPHYRISPTKNDNGVRKNMNEPIDCVVRRHHDLDRTQSSSRMSISTAFNMSENIPGMSDESSDDEELPPVERKKSLNLAPCVPFVVQNGRNPNNFDNGSKEETNNSPSTAKSSSSKGEWKHILSDEKRGAAGRSPVHYQRIKELLSIDDLSGAETFNGDGYDTMESNVSQEFRQFGKMQWNDEYTQSTQDKSDDEVDLSLSCDESEYNGHLSLEQYHTVTFRYANLTASKAYITGSFVDWKGYLPMEKDSEGFHITFPLPKGEYGYKYVTEEEEMFKKISLF